MKPFVFFAILSGAVLSPALRADAVFDAGLRAEKAGDAETALKYFLQADRAKPNDDRIEQRVARQYSDLAELQPTPEKRREYTEQALHYSELAVKLAPNNAEHVLSLAICHGKLATYGDNAAKIRYAGLIKQEAERATQLDPRYGWAHYVLGRWNYEVARRNGAEKFFAKVLYGGLPPGSNDVAIHELKLATELDPTEPAAWIDLGFAYAAAGKSAEAKAAWAKGMQLPARRIDQLEARDRAKSALASN